MSLDLTHTIDSVKKETIEVAEIAHEKTSEFHENYVSKVLPDCGKYGDVAKFVAEMAPGVSEYNAIVDGDWQAFAIAAGIDITGVAIGAVTGGTGYVAIKGLAKAGTKKAVKEVAKAGAKKAAKEVAEAGAEKAAKEVAEAGTEKVTKEGAEAATKEVDEAAQIVKNRIDGAAREEKVLKDLRNEYSENNIISQAVIRDSSGKIIRDPITNEARRIDFVVTDGKKVIKSIEVTSETAPKKAQIEKELRILKQAREMGGAYIKNDKTGELIKFGKNITTEIMREK